MTAEDPLPTTMQRSIVYRFTCCCGHTYVGKTTQQVAERIKQHIPEKLFKPRPTLRIEKSDSAITKHLKGQPDCITELRDNVMKHFQVIAHARSQLHLDVLEALHTKGLGGFALSTKGVCPAVTPVLNGVNHAFLSSFVFTRIACCALDGT